jgi:hypothetical protein
LGERAIEAIAAEERGAMPRHSNVIESGIRSTSAQPHPGSTDQRRRQFSLRPDILV